MSISVFHCQKLVFLFLERVKRNQRMCIRGQQFNFTFRYTHWNLHKGALGGPKCDIYLVHSLSKDSKMLGDTELVFWGFFFFLSIYFRKHIHLIGVLLRIELFGWHMVFLKISISVGPWYSQVKRMRVDKRFHFHFILLNSIQVVTRLRKATTGWLSWPAVGWRIRSAFPRMSLSLPLF